MILFISWSGPLSKALGEAMKDFLRHLFPSELEIYFSPDIEKGDGWDDSIMSNLKSAQMGILCMTPLNLESLWLNYEAGALASKIGKSKVSPILFNIKSSALKSPISRFQATTFDINDMKKLVLSINEECEKKADKDVLLKNVDRFWSELESVVSKILSSDGTAVAKPRSTDDMLEEILALTRKNSNQVDDANGKAGLLQKAIKEYFGGITQFHAATQIANNTRVYFHELKLLNFALKITHEMDYGEDEPNLTATLSRMKAETVERIRALEGNRHDDILNTA